MPATTLPFLQQVARAMLQMHGTALKDVAVVLPSQRAGLYLRKWLAEEAGRSLWSPQVFTLASFMEELSGLRPLATEELLFEGYAAYRAVEGEQAQALGEFLQWGGTMLADISEADAHQVPLESYYRDLRHWEQIEWTFNNDPLSEGQTRMVRFWAMVGKLHAALNERLLQIGAGTSGLIERTAVARLRVHPQPWKQVWFAGLNALDPAQQAVVQHFVDRGTAQLAWDADRYYLDRPEQEAGTHLRKFIGRYGKGAVPASGGLDAGGLHVQTVRTPNDAAQAWCAAALLGKATPQERANTAVVLADESLLQPLLEALPPEIGPLNITMGLSVARLPVGAYLDALHRLHARHATGTGFLLADLERFLGHPFLQQGAAVQPLAQALAALRERNRMHVAASEVRAIMEQHGLPEDAVACFGEVADAAGRMPAISAHALAWARQAVADDAFATEQLFQASHVLHRIHLLLGRYAQEVDREAYATLFRKLLAATRIGFFGEPLAGVQVMGMLEARALDPDRLILLGAQEGTLPNAAQERSFIPYELRRAHGMPLRTDQDAVQAYNFLRMLQRCRQATLVWPEGAEATGPAGPSRFILQLGHELLHGRAEQPRRMDLHLPMPRPSEAQVVVRKDEALLTALRNRLEKGLSPSALGDWLRCPLDLYFKQVLRLRETDVHRARIAANVLGEAMHSAVEAVYAPLMGRPLQPEALEHGAESMEALLRHELAKGTGTGSLRSGQPLLQVHIAVRAAQRFLRSEAALLRSGAVITVLEQEAAMKHPLALAGNAIGSPVHLQGRLDRVDRRNGTLRILDLKSGKVDANALKLDGLDPGAITEKNRYAVQLLVYAWLYLSVHPGEIALQAGLMPLQQADSSEPVLLHVKGSNLITRAKLEPMEALFTALITDMMDPGKALVHDPMSKYCKFCLAEEP